MSDHVDTQIDKLRRAKALAVKCSQRLEPPVAKRLKDAQISEAGGTFQIVFRDAPPVNLAIGQVDGGSLEQLAESLISLARERSGEA